MTLTRLPLALAAVPLEPSSHKKESLLLFIVLLIGLLFLLFWTVLLYRAFRKPTQSKILEDLEELVMRNQLLTDLAACLSTFIGTAFIIYWYGFLEEGTPAPAQKLMAVGVVLFGSAPFFFSKIFLRLKAKKFKQTKKNKGKSF